MLVLLSNTTSPALPSEEEPERSEMEPCNLFISPPFVNWLPVVMLRLPDICSERPELTRTFPEFDILPEAVTKRTPSTPPVVSPLRPDFKYMDAPFNATSPPDSLVEIEVPTFITILPVPSIEEPVNTRRFPLFDTSDVLPDPVRLF